MTTNTLFSNIYWQAHTSSCIWIYLPQKLETPFFYENNGCALMQVNMISTILIMHFIDFVSIRSVNKRIYSKQQKPINMTFVCAHHTMYMGGKDRPQLIVK